MQAVFDVFNGINPFDKFFDGNPDGDLLKDIRVFAERSPLKEHEISSALKILEILDSYSYLNIKNIDDLNALNYLIGTNEALIHALPRYKKLSDYLEKFTFRGVIVDSPRVDQSVNRQNSQIERLIKENKILQERLLQMNKELEQQQLSSAMELSQSQVFSMERFGGCLQNDYSLNKDFNKWIDALLEFPPMLKEILSKMTVDDQSALLRVLLKVETRSGGLRIFLREACQLVDEGVAEKLKVFEQKVSILEKERENNLRQMSEALQTIAVLTAQIRINEERIEELNRQQASIVQASKDMDLKKVSQQCKVATVATQTLNLESEKVRQETPSTELEELKTKYEALWLKNRTIEEEKCTLESTRKELLLKIFNIRQLLQTTLWKFYGGSDNLTLELEQAQAVQPKLSETVSEELNMLQCLIEDKLISLLGTYAKKVLELNDAINKHIEGKRDLESNHGEQLIEMDAREKALFKEFEQLKKELLGEIINWKELVKQLDEKNKGLETRLGLENLQVKKLQKKIEELESQIAMEDFSMLGVEGDLNELRDKNKLLLKQIKEFEKIKESLEYYKGEVEFLSSKLTRTSQAEETSRKKNAQLEKELASSNLQLEIGSDNFLALEHSRKRLEREKYELSKEPPAPPSLNNSIQNDVNLEELQLLRKFVESDSERKQQFDKFLLKVN